jgi:hypothetical protein
LLVVHFNFGWRALIPGFLSSFQHGQCSSGFPIMALLTQDGFNLCVFSPERGKLFLRHFCLLSARRDMIAFA